MAKRKPAKDRPIYLRVARLMVPETGEIVGALIPDGDIDRRLMRERGYHLGQQVRATLAAPRNCRFHRLVHGLGGIVAGQVPGFEGMTAHAAIKRLQTESGMYCDESAVDVPGVGALMIRQPQSIAFDSMDEGDFRRLWAGICAHLITRYWPGLTPEQIEHMVDLMPEQESAA